MSRATEDEMRITTINKELLEAYRAEEEYWKQRSRQMWLTLGDKKTQGFFMLPLEGEGLEIDLPFWKTKKEKLCTKKIDLGSDQSIFLYYLHILRL